MTAARSRFRKFKYKSDKVLNQQPLDNLKYELKHDFDKVDPLEVIRAMNIRPYQSLSKRVLQLKSEKLENWDK